MVDVSDQRRAEAETAARLHHFHQLVEAVPTVVWTSTPEGEVNYLNSRWTQLTGMPQEASLGRGWTKVVHPDDVERCHRRWTEARIKQESYDVEIRCRTASGNYRWMLARAEPLFDPGGRLVLWFGVYTDIEER